MKKYGRISFVSCVLIVFLAAFSCISSIPVQAEITDSYIRFSNIGNTSNNPSAALPITAYDTRVSAKNDSGKTLVRVADLVTYLGASFSVNPNNSNEWILTRNGNTVKFYNNSTYFTSTVTYSITDPATATSKAYTQTMDGYSDVNAQIINNEKYVRLTTAANQLGALVVGYDSTSGEARIFDWRVYNSTPLSDSNVYIIGGPWVSSWSGKGTVKLSDHFAINEMWDHSTSAQNPSYYSQLKISVASIQAAENVRYHYNSNSSMSLSCAFRSWIYNNTLTGSWVKSFHMRGRAWDAPADALYTSVYNEFKGTYSTPLDAGGGFWRTRVSNGKSGGREIEKMPSGGSTWLHLQVVPEYGSIQ